MRLCKWFTEVVFLTPKLTEVPVKSAFSASIATTLSSGKSDFIHGIPASTAIARSEANTMALDGLKTIPSHFGTKETIDRLDAEIKAKGLTVFARIDHAAGAAAVGM